MLRRTNELPLTESYRRCLRMKQLKSSCTRARTIAIVAAIPPNVRVKNFRKSGAVQTWLDKCTYVLLEYSRYPGALLLLSLSPLLDGHRVLFSRFVPEFYTRLLNANPRSDRGSNLPRAGAGGAGRSVKRRLLPQTGANWFGVLCL